MPRPGNEQELARERETLVKADRDIAEGEERIARQAELVEELRRHGHTVVNAEATLDALQQTLEAWRVHRKLIIQSIARLEGEARTAAGPMA